MPRICYGNRKEPSGEGAPQGGYRFWSVGILEVAPKDLRTFSRQHEIDDSLVPTAQAHAEEQRINRHVPEESSLSLLIQRGIKAFARSEPKATAVEFNDGKAC